MIKLGMRGQIFRSQPHYLGRLDKTYAEASVAQLILNRALGCLSGEDSDRQAMLLRSFLDLLW
jgi:hypothetical protein